MNGKKWGVEDVGVPAKINKQTINMNGSVACKRKDGRRKKMLIRGSNNPLGLGMPPGLIKICFSCSNTLFLARHERQRERERERKGKGRYGE